MTRILLSNDDGIHAAGLRAARKVLDEFGEVTTVVPDREMSGSSHAITLHHPLRVDEIGTRLYIVNGTPTDCVNLALNEILSERPDLVFSGINPGINVGLDLSYSGTVAAALEAALQGVPAIAVSLAAAADVSDSQVEQLVTRIVRQALELAAPGMLLNVNLPAGKIRGIRCSVQGEAGYRSEIIKKADPRGRSYYWIGGQHAHESEGREHSDIATLKAGFASVTPLRLDLTDHLAYEKLESTWRVDN